MYDDNDFFADADYNDVEAREPQSFKLDPGKHFVKVTKAGLIDTKNGKTFIITFTNEDNKDFTQFFNPIEAGDENKPVGDTNMRDIKRQERVTVLVALGIPKSEIPRLRPEDLEGISGEISLYKNAKGYIKFGGFKPNSGGAVGTPLRKTEAVHAPIVSQDMSAAANLDDFGI